jgi:PRA1 family protein
MTATTRAEQESILSYAPLVPPRASASAVQPPAAGSSTAIAPAAGSSTTEAEHPLLDAVHAGVSRAQTALDVAVPWPVFFNVRAISMPRFSELADRVETNWNVFRANYEVVAAAFLLLSVVTNFGGFLVAGLLLLAVERFVRRKLRASPIGQLEGNHKLVVAICVLGILWLTAIGLSVVSALFSATMFVGIHAALRTPVSTDPPTPAVSAAV